MIYLILCILSSTGIFLIFKTIDHKRLPSFPAIIINYLVASILGFFLNKNIPDPEFVLSQPWFPVSVIIGFLFIVMFFLVAKSSSEAGISVTTVASKMSVVFPITFSLIIAPNDNLSLIKTMAIIATIIGVFLTIYKPGKLKSNLSEMYIPLLLFMGMGIVDSLVKFAQHEYVSDQHISLFSGILFTMAFLTGILILPFRQEGISEFRKSSVWMWGVLLGLVNFGSIFFMVSALNHVNDSGNIIDSSIIFGANNIGIVSLSVLSGLLIFREELKKINWIGIGVSIMAIILFTLA